MLPVRSCSCRAVTCLLPWVIASRLLFRLLASNSCFFFVYSLKSCDNNSYCLCYTCLLPILLPVVVDCEFVGLTSCYLLAAGDLEFSYIDDSYLRLVAIGKGGNGRPFRRSFLSFPFFSLRCAVCLLLVFGVDVI